MKNILVLMGGESTEHDISLITGVQVINNLDTKKYAIYPVVIDKQGEWHFSSIFCNIKNIIEYFASKKQNKNTALLNNKTLYLKKKNRLKKVANMDCAVLCCHGGIGENGALQGFLECMGIAMVSAGHTSSGLFMDKSLSKVLFEKLGLLTAKAAVISKKDYYSSQKQTLEKLKKEIGSPYFIKPASLGSSIGVGLAANTPQLKERLEEAFCYDRNVIVEEAVQNLFELNIAVARFDDKINLSQIEKPCNKNKILSFEDKYLGGGKSGLNNMGRQLPAVISKEQQDFIENSAQKIYSNFIQKGIVRIDYLVDEKSGKVYVNEVNTIPGSFAFYLWKDLSFGLLLDKLIVQAFSDRIKEKGIEKSFSSSVLDRYSGGGKIGKL